MNDIQTVLLEIEQDYQTKQAELEAHRAKKRDEALTKLKNQFGDSLAETINILHPLPADVKHAILSDKEIGKLLRALDTSKTKVSGNPRTRRSDDEYIAFLTSWCSPADLAKHFAPLTAAGAKGVLDRLLAAKKITRRANPERKGKFQYKAA